MNKPISFYFLIAGLLLLISLAGCSGGSTLPQAGSTVQSYLQALAAKDANKMMNLSCATWEPQAKVEYDSFAAVKLTTKDLACKETGKDGSASLVSCSGSITANYGAEELPIDVAGQTYRVVQEGGEWRVCGYQK
jgi:hypothetical protein